MFIVCLAYWAFLLSKRLIRDSRYLTIYVLKDGTRILITGPIVVSTNVVSTKNVFVDARTHPLKGKGLNEPSTTPQTKVLIEGTGGKERKFLAESLDSGHTYRVAKTPDEKADIRQKLERELQLESVFRGEIYPEKLELNDAEPVEILLKRSHLTSLKRSRLTSTFSEIFELPELKEDKAEAKKFIITDTERAHAEKLGHRYRLWGISRSRLKEWSMGTLMIMGTFLGVMLAVYFAVANNANWLETIIVTFAPFVVHFKAELITFGELETDFGSLRGILLMIVFVTAIAGIARLAVSFVLSRRKNRSIRELMIEL